MSGNVIHLAYLGPGGPEFLLVMLVLLVLFGAKDAPRILRKLNEIINQVRNTADGFKREVMYSDLNAEPDTYEATDIEEEYDGGYDYDQDQYYSDDEMTGEGEAVGGDEVVGEDEADAEDDGAGEESEEIAAETEPETSESGEDDARKV